MRVGRPRRMNIARVLTAASKLTSQVAMTVRQLVISAVFLRFDYLLQYLNPRDRNRGETHPPQS